MKPSVRIFMLMIAMILAVSGFTPKIAQSTSDTIPYNEILNDNISLEHEAKVSKVSEEQLFYLMSRGISEQEATEMIVMGFIEPFTKELPMEYAVEMNRLIKFEMEGSIG